MAIKVNMNPHETTTAFTYLGITINYNNSHWEALYSNPWKAQRGWGVETKVLVKTGAPIKSRAMMYKAVVQAVLLYGRIIWVMTDAMIMVIEGFHHRISRSNTGRTERKGDFGEWEWALVGAELETMGIWMLREYTRRRQETNTEYVAGRPILELCTYKYRMEGSIRFLRYWNQDHKPNKM